MLKLTPEWSKSYPVRPRNHLQSLASLEGKHKIVASFENEECPTTISSLIRWEYARRWLEERDRLIEKSKITPKRFKNDYKSWLEKRKRRVNEK